MIDAGANPKAIHGPLENPDTFDVYGHLLPGSRDEVRERTDSYSLPLAALRPNVLGRLGCDIEARRTPLGVRSARDYRTIATSDIAQFLRGLPTSSFVPRPSGTVAILVSRVEDADGDIDEIRAWVSANGGSEGTATARPSTSLQAGRLVRQPPRSSQYFVVPCDRLR